MLLPFALAAVLAGATPPSLSAPLVTAEQSFAADAPRLGSRLAFLAHFDAGSWLLRPYPVPALDALARDVDDGGPLQWTPDTVGVAASGDMGFTSGPWSAPAAGTDRVEHGHFLTVWKRGGDGVWRVQVDGGIGHAALDKAAGPVKTIAVGNAGEATPSADALTKRRHALEAADDALRAALASAQGDRAAIWHRAADANWRALRPSQLPADGEAAFTLAASDPARRGSGTRRALDVASSGDLAYSIGGDASCKECGSYYRVWHWCDGRWQLLVDVETP